MPLKRKSRIVFPFIDFHATTSAGIFYQRGKVHVLLIASFVQCGRISGLKWLIGTSVELNFAFSMNQGWKFRSWKCILQSALMRFERSRNNIALEGLTCVK
jgi:hypothetical protein